MASWMTGFCGTSMELPSQIPAEHAQTFEFIFLSSWRAAQRTQ